MRTVCIQEVKLMDVNGEEKLMKRHGEKFSCECGKKFERSDKFKLHWKSCQTPKRNLSFEDVLMVRIGTEGKTIV
jgi:hypothetical protein